MTELMPGVSTQRTQILLEDGFAEDGCIAVTQPRRVVRSYGPNPDGAHSRLSTV